MRRIFRCAGWLALLVVTAMILLPAGFLGWVAWREAGTDLPGMRAGFDDASRLVENRPDEVITIAGDQAEAEQQIVEQVKRAQLDRVIAVAGASHSMGGQSLVNGGVVLDLHALRHMSLGEDGTLTVGAGARWKEVIPFLDERGRAVKVMQSNNDFSVGGSLSVNCHGWQHNSPPIASTVKALRVVIASGDVVRCSRTEHAALFSHVLGGYGLFGVISRRNWRRCRMSFIGPSRSVSLRTPSPRPGLRSREILKWEWLMGG